MPLLLTAATLSEDSFQRPLLLLVKLRLAEVLLYLDNVQHAKDLVDSIMGMVSLRLRHLFHLDDVLVNGD